jgi:cell division protein FtsW
VVFSFLLLLAVFIPKVGITVSGARRWIRLWPSTFQPSELVKLSMVIFLARYISMPYFKKDSFISFLIPIGIMAIFQAVFLFQPDFGATINLGIITITMLILGGTKLRYIMYLAALSIPVLVKLVMQPYRLKRILAFLDPWSDPQGSGFQLIQSFIALGSGGLTGVGPGNGKQKLSFLPEIHTDFIFSLIGEELGFIGALGVVSLFLFLFYKGMSIANRMETGFRYYLAYGLTIMIVLQAIINFSVATGLVPTKGLPLPFISYGGSSLLVNMIAIGILLNLSRGLKPVKIKDTGEIIIEKKKAYLSVYGRIR